MKVKYMMIMESVLIVLLAGLLVTQCVTLKKREPVVREPRAPGESAISYTPPPEPKFPLDSLRQIGVLRKMVKPEILEITPDIYLAKGFALGSVQMVVTGEGVVIIDTTESEESAREILERFRKITDKPIRYIIYTHSHPDHIKGASVFMEDGTEVIATNAAVEKMKKDFLMLGGFVKRGRTIQSGKAAPEYSRPLPVKTPFRGLGRMEVPVWPTITFDEEYSFRLGGKTFELYHTTGETPGHLMVWLPDERALFPGDLFYRSFPNLSTPMLESRPVKGWYLSLERIIAMEPEYLVPGHTDPVTGKENIREILTDYSNAIRYVYEETVEGINRGETVDEIARSIKLPPELAGKPYLREYYGRVDWSVRGIHRKLTGWYDGKGTGLAPLPPRYKARELVGLAGGADKILGRAIELQKAGEHQLACELCDVVIAANPDDKMAHMIKAASLDYLGVADFNLNTFGFYRSAAAMERKAAGVTYEEMYK